MERFAKALRTRAATLGLLFFCGTVAAYSVTTETPPWYVHSLRAAKYLQGEDLAGAEEYYRKAVQDCTHDGITGEKYVDSLSNLAQVSMAMNHSSLSNKALLLAEREIHRCHLENQPVMLRYLRRKAEFCERSGIAREDVVLRERISALALQLFGDSSQTYLRAAQDAMTATYAVQDFNGALALARSCLASMSKSHKQLVAERWFSAYAVAGLSLYYSKRYGEAIKYLSQAIDCSTKNNLIGFEQFECMRALAECQFEEKNETECVRCMRSLIERLSRFDQVESAMGQYVTGYNQLRLGQLMVERSPTEAGEHYLKAISALKNAKKTGQTIPDVDATLAVSYLNLFDWYCQKGDLQKAEDIVTLEIQPVLPPSMVPNLFGKESALANRYCKMGSYAKAADVYARALQLVESPVGSKEKVPLPESFSTNYQTCLSKLGRNKDAGTVALRCRRILESRH